MAKHALVTVLMIEPRETHLINFSFRDEIHSRPYGIQSMTLLSKSIFLEMTELHSVVQIALKEPKILIHIPIIRVLTKTAIV